MSRRDSDEVVVLRTCSRLPFSPEILRLVLAPHMLYHVPDIEVAASDIRRCTPSPDGLSVAVRTAARTSKNSERSWKLLSVWTGR